MCCNPGEDSPCSMGLGQQMLLGVTPFPVGHRSQCGQELAGRESCLEQPHCLFGTYTACTNLLPRIRLVAWFLPKAFYISHS